MVRGASGVPLETDWTGHRPSINSLSWFLSLQERRCGESRRGPARGAGRALQGGLGWEAATLGDVTDRGEDPGGDVAPFPQPQGEPRPAPVRRQSSANYRAYATEPHAKVRVEPALWAGPGQSLDSEP